ncbi:hypothetical protein GCM10010465_09760 [Actinomadura fibrosa]
MVYSSIAWSQTEKFGDVKKKDLQEKMSEEEKAAGAVVLFKGRETHFEYDENTGWYLVTEYYERVKITEQKGLEAATKKIDVYLDGNKKEKVTRIKGNTYNLIGGKLQRESLENDWIFENQLTENRLQYTFTMPKVSVGSIVEWEYKVTSPFWKIDDLVMQQEIPVRHYFAKILVPQFFQFKVVKKGFFKIEPREYIENRKMYVSWKDKDSYGRILETSKGGTLSLKEVVTEFEVKDIPSLQPEPYVDNIENYRYSIIYELQSTAFPNLPKKKYSSSWGEVAKAIFEFEDFGGQLKDGRFLKEEVARISDSAKSLRERMDLAFGFVKNGYTWNGKLSKYAEQDLEKTYKSRTGNVADINLTLILLLRECGLKANPVLLSTRSHGKPIFPTIEGFNYVIAGVRFDDEIILLDATEKWSNPGMLPERVYNWVGRMVEENGYSREVELLSREPSREDVIVNYELKEDGSIEGQLRRRFSLLEAMKFRKKFEGANAYEQSLLKEFGLDEVTGLEVNNLEEIEKPVDESFHFVRKNAFDKVENSIYFSPMNFLALLRSPFFEEVRQFPVNFSYPFETSYSFNIALPEGYEISYMPESGLITFGESGEFKYIINQVNGNIRLRVSFSIQEPFIPQDQYTALQKFFDQRVEKENEKVVLLKRAL